MNFWATVEHSLNYKYDKYVPVEIRQRLMKAADAAARLDEEMAFIREEIVSAQVAFENKSLVVAEITLCIKKIEQLDCKEEALYYQKRLDALNEDKETEGLLDLKTEVNLFLIKLLEETK